MYIYQLGLYNFLHANFATNPIRENSAGNAGYIGNQAMSTRAIFVKKPGELTTVKQSQAQGLIRKK